jgi:anti-anti-sigma factor
VRLVSNIGPPSFEITVSPAPDGVIVAVSGEVDLVTAPAVEAALRQQLADLQGLSFMDSSGIQVLDAILRDLAPNDWALVIDPALQPPVRQVIALTGLTDALPFEATVP